MNDDFLAAAQRFGDAPRVLNPFDLGIALFLEYFAMPVLCYGTYVPLRRRRLLPDLTTEWRTWISQHLPADATPDWIALAAWARTAIDGAAEQQEFLDIIGRSFYRRNLRRQQEIRRANIVSGVVLVLAILVHIVSVLGMILTTWWLLLPWLNALIITNLICRVDLHWKPKRVSESA